MILGFRPGLRNAHTATFINNTLYILGGIVPPEQQTFLYLNFSVPFNTNELEWHELSNDNVILPHRHAAAIGGGASNNTLFLYGGLSPTGEAMGLVYTFDTQNNTWNIPKITGIPPTGKVFITPIIDYNGLMYLFGGYSSELNNYYTNDMFILDTMNLSWKKANSINAPSPRIEYGAVFLPNQKIIYMGGYLGFELFSLNEVNISKLFLEINQIINDFSDFIKVYLYDTINDNWTTKTTYGSIPSARFSFSSVLGLDGQRIIIYGGSGQNKQIMRPENSIYVLDINNFYWYIPKITGNFSSNRVSHKSVIIEKYMVITFGEGYAQEKEDDILLLDISNNDEYIWTTSFNPTKTDSHSNLSSLSRSIIIGICVIIGIVGIIICVRYIYTIYIRNIRSIYYDHNNQLQQDRAVGDRSREGQRETEKIDFTTSPSNKNIKLQNFMQEVREEMENKLISSSQYNDQANNFNFDNRITRDTIDQENLHVLRNRRGGGHFTYR